jgi:hypothetical protein
LFLILYTLYQLRPEAYLLAGTSLTLLHPPERSEGKIEIKKTEYKGQKNTEHKPNRNPLPR